MGSIRTYQYSYKKLTLAILASILLHLCMALMVYLWMKPEEEEIPEKVPVTPFEVAVIEEESEAGEPLPPANERSEASEIDTPELETMPPPQPKQHTPQKTPSKPKSQPTKVQPQHTPEKAPKGEKEATSPLESDSAPRKRSTIFVQKGEKEAEPDFRISGALFQKTFKYNKNQELTMRMRGQKRFVGLEQDLKMAKVSLRNVSGGTIRPGNNRAVVSETAQQFLERLHDYIHQQWAMEYIPHLNMSGSNYDKINDLSLNAEIELVLQGATGKPIEIVIARSSGVGAYDTKALLVTKHAATTGPVPKSLWSSNGKVYIHWNYWRDQRQCGIFGANVYLLDERGNKKGNVTSVAP